MINNPHQFTSAGRIRKPLYSTLAQWVGESWNYINPSIIRKAFKCCSISVAMDRSEDDLVFDYEALELNINDISSEEYEEAEGNSND
ncbi:19172_t:CDS:2 [Gigaspora margarita]|uniref:19172_t:CDS:1 n=1 Tax=Gigaspora margarita TaxID=4874 RepID=A0ABN7V0A6_GIGMA|nr:19172_t:CDS:2 [Gigaspora margarita]